MRACSSATGLIAVCDAPRAAKTTVLAPDPVSNVVMPGWTLRSSQASASHCRPRYAWPACTTGGSARIESVSGVSEMGRHVSGWGPGPLGPPCARTKQRMTYEWEQIFLLSWRVGASGLLRGVKGPARREAVARLACPLDPVRYIEMPVVLNRLVA